MNETIASLAEKWDPSSREMYLKGQKEEQLGNLASAKEFYEAAGEYPPAQYRLALLIKAEIGDNYQENPEKTGKILDLLNASKKSYLPAAYLLGEMYRCKGDEIKAKDFYFEAHALQAISLQLSNNDGEIDICLAKMYYYGRGKPPNFTYAHSYCESAKKKGNTEASILLTQWLNERNIQIVNADGTPYEWE